MSHMKQNRPTTRDAIIEAAFDLFGRDPSAPLGDIAARAGVGRATLHRHFAGRDDLIVELTRIAMEELDTAVQAAVKDAPSWTAALERSLRAVIPLANRNWFLAQERADQNPEIATALAAERAELTEAIDQARKEGAFAPDAPTPWIAAAFDSLIYAAWETVRRGELTPTQAADLAWRTLTRGLNGGGLNDQGLNGGTQ